MRYGIAGTLPRLSMKAEQLRDCLNSLRGRPLVTCSGFARDPITRKGVTPRVAGEDPNRVKARGANGDRETGDVVEIGAGSARWLNGGSKRQWASRVAPCVTVMSLDEFIAAAL
jgi:hypothetical protein